MKPYILISVWAPDDHATPLSHAFATKFNDKHRATRFLQGEAPAHDEVKQAIETYPYLPVIIFGHGGAVIAARSGGEPWAHPAQLAAMMSGRRVYAFACSTFTPQSKLLMSNFATRAVDECIQTFVGHQAPVMTPFANVDDVRTRMDDVIQEMLETFIDGENEMNALQDVGRRRVNWELPVDLDLSTENPEMEGALGWSSAAFLGTFFNSICTESKPVERSYLSDLLATTDAFDNIQ